MTKEYRGPLAWCRRWNFRRVERRRWLRELFEAIPANDAALLEGVTRLLERGAEEASLRAAWQATVDQRFEALAGQMASGKATADRQFEAQAGQMASRQATADRQLEVLAGQMALGQASADRQLEALAGQLALGQANLLKQLESISVQLAACQVRFATTSEAVGQAAPDSFPVIPTARQGLVEPELDLLLELAPSLIPRVAIDVGAHHGTFSDALLASGFEVHALEPNPTVFDELVRRMGGRPGFKAHPLAASSMDGEGDLRLVSDPTGTYVDPTQLASMTGLPPPPGLVSAGTVQVTVCRLDTFVRKHGISPPSFVKVDAEGMDLEVMRGLGTLRPAMLQVEFWDEELPFSGPGARNRLPDLVARAREMGMPWHLVVFRRWGDDRAAFYSGRSGSPERSWGNILFFSDHALYERARRRLATTLPEARFVAARQP